MFIIGICGAIGGNSGNGVNTGTFYFNLNTTPGNRNWNIAAAQTYLIFENNAPHFPYLLVKQLFRFHTHKDKGRFLDFMGFRFYRNRVTLRRKIALKAMRKARRIAFKKHTTAHDARQMLTYIGWTNCTDTYKWFKKHILAMISVRKLKGIISRYDRAKALKGAYK